MAPLSPEWTWRQTDTTVTVDVKAKGVAKKTCDIFLSDQFLKVNASPYLLALDLWQPIVEDKSTATISKGRITVQLVKAEKGAWESLHIAIKDREQKEAVLARRKASIERAQAKQDARRKERAALRQKEEKEALDRSFDLDKRKRQAIDDAKEKELRQARDEIKSFTAPAPAPQQQKKVTFADNDDDDSDTADSESDGERDEAAAAATVDDDTEEEEEEEEEVVVILPPPRETLQPVSVEFTPTIVDNLPAREGREEELKLISRSQGKMRLTDSDTDLAERHPVFLKDKGDKMCKQGNFRGAVHAYR